MWCDCYNFTLCAYIYIHTHIQQKVMKPWVNTKNISPLKAKIRMIEIHKNLILNSQQINIKYKYKKCADVTEYISTKGIA